MRKLILLALVGLAAQLVDGSLGMAYGVTSSSLLLAIGANPAVASATVHLAEVGTTFVSGVSHWRFGNVDWRVVLRIGIPGALGSLLGATVLSRLSTEVAAPLMSVILLVLGLYVLVRFTVHSLPTGRVGQPLRRRFLTPLGLVAGFVDATGGGGWGPVGTPAILASGRMEPRKVIGSIDTSEFLVSVAASLGFLIGLGSAGVNLAWAAMLLAGGVVAAPLAAWLVRHLPPRVLGAAVGGLIVLTNARTLLGGSALDAAPDARVLVYAAVTALWVCAVAWSVRAHLRERALPAADGQPTAVEDGAAAVQDGAAAVQDGAAAVQDGATPVQDGTAAASRR